MSERILSNEVATLLKDLSPDEAKALLIKLKSDAIAAAKEVREQSEVRRVNPKELKKHFKQYDAGLGLPTDLHQRRRMELVKKLNWKKSDGLVPLHFAGKPTGSKCFWACIWHTADGHLKPGEIFDVGTMTALELLIEGIDLLYQQHNLAGVRKPDPVWVKREIGPIIKVYEDGGIPDLNSLRKKLRQIRESYCTYIAPWAPPEHSFQPVYRPGWGHAPIQEEFESGEVVIKWKPEN